MTRTPNRASVAYAERAGLTATLTQDFRAVPGKGVKAQVGGAEVLAGKPSILEERGVALSGDVRERIHTLFTSSA